MSCRSDGRRQNVLFALPVPLSPGINNLDKNSRQNLELQGLIGKFLSSRELRAVVRSQVSVGSTIRRADVAVCRPRMAFPSSSLFRPPKMSSHLWSRLTDRRRATCAGRHQRSRRGRV